GPGPDDVRIAGKDRERAETAVRLLAEDVLPHQALAGRLPDAAARRADVQHRWILRVDLDVVDASARHRRTDVAEVQLVEGRARGLSVGARRRLGAGRREQSQREQDG